MKKIRKQMLKNKLSYLRFTLPAVLFVLILLNGCSLDFDAVDNLIRAPKLTGRYAAIESVFEKAVGSNVKLKSPRSGAYRTAYVLYDYDADLVEEAIVFYSSETDEMTVRIHFLDYLNGEWVSAADEAGKESEIHEVQFQDLNGDNCPEILIVYNKKNSNRILSVYNVRSKSNTTLPEVLSLATVQCANYRCLDMNADGSQEILYTVFETSAETGLQIPFVKVLSKDDNGEQLQYSVAASFAIDAEISSFEAITSDSLKEQTRAYVDCRYADDISYLTQIITWTPEKGYYMYVNEELMLQPYITTRLNRVFTADADADGVAELPDDSELPLSSAENMPADTVYLPIQRRYYRCDTDGLLTEAYCYYLDPLQEYKLNLTTLSLQDRLSVTCDYAERKTRFYEYDPIAEDRGEELFSIRVETTGSGALACYCEVAPYGEELGFKSDEVLSAISLNTKETEVMKDEANTGR